MSRDERIGRVIAFESLARDLAGPVRRGVANVFVVFRRAPWTSNGSPWRAGRTVLVSRGRGGGAANGPSYAPDVSGDSAHQHPRCVAFVSRASNLVSGDRNGHADAFVADLDTGAITRVSVASDGSEADGTTSEVAVDGGCTRVAFVSDASSLTRGDGHWPGAASDRPLPGTRQVYVHFLDRGAARSVAGLTLLVSRAGRAPSAAGAAQLALASNGLSVAYTAASRVWQTDLRIHGGGVALTTRLVAAAPSMSPSLSHDGAHVAFVTRVPALTGIPDEGVWQIVLTAPRTPAAAPVVVSKSQFVPSPSNGHRGPPPVPGTASSLDPEISEGGQWVFFDSRAPNLITDRTMTQREVYRWTDPALKAIYDLSGIQVKSMAGTGTASGYVSVTPAEAPAISARGNYATFESEDPILDTAAVGRSPAWVKRDVQRRPTGLAIPGLATTALRRLPGAGGTPDPGVATAPGDLRLHQVFLRYLGPQ